MRLSDTGLNLIKSFEGLRLTAYTCAAGRWTIGWGHTGTVAGKKVSRGMRITRAVAESLIRQDVARFERAVNDRRYVPFVPNQHQFDALASFAFNAGESNLKRLCAGRTPGEVASAMLLYRKAGGVVNQGLIDRRVKERKLFVTGMDKVACCPYPMPSKIVTSSANARERGCKAFVVSGDVVKGVQWHLVRHGHKLKVDGICGEKTVAAIQAFQCKHSLTVDGLCGPKTLAALQK